MAVAKKRPGFSWMWFLLLSGLSLLSWISTYTGIMELIAASTGEITWVPRVAVAFAVFMLQLMILYVLDTMFSGEMRWWLWPLYIVGYCVLFLISVGFAFGFYWKYLEAGAVTTAAAEASLREVQQTLQLGTTRLEQMQSTFATLSEISEEKAEREREQGGTCPGSPPGDGPRRQLRDADAQRFRFANQYTASRVEDVKEDIGAVNRELQKILRNDPSTIDASGSRRGFISDLNRQLALVATRFNALRSDPQLLQLRDEFAARAEQTRFPNGRGGTFVCPDPQLETAINGVVRAIDELPQLDPPVLQAYEGSTAVIEAFNRLRNSSMTAVQEFGASLQNTLAGYGVGDQAAPVQARSDGLSERDFIPLMIAIFVDLCILLVSVNRPFGPFFELSRSMDAARRSGAMSHYLATFYKVFQDQFDPAKAPTAADVIAPIQDVVFDHKGRYYAAVPLDFREEDYMKWLERRRGPSQAERIFQATSERPLEESRYITSVFATLEGSGFVTLVEASDEGLDAALVKQKLEQQGSVYAQADAFRLYRFGKRAWAQILIESVASSAAESERRWRQTSKQGGQWEAPEMPSLSSRRDDYRGEAKAVGPGEKRESVTEDVSGRAALEHRREGIDDDPDTDQYDTPRFNGNQSKTNPKKDGNDPSRTDR